MAFLHAAASHVKGSGLKKGRLPYLLLAPGLIFLFTFFILPIANLATTSTQTPAGETGVYEQTWQFSNYLTAFTENKEQFGRSFLYAFLTTILALAIAYPLAYAITFKSGKYKIVLLVLVVAPFFTSFLLRTIAWKQILGAEGPVVSTLQSLHLISPTTTLTASSFAVVSGMTYNFLPFLKKRSSTCLAVSTLNPTNPNFFIQEP